LLSLMEGIWGWNLGVDQLLFAAGADDIPGSIRPGLMSPLTAWGFFGLGLALLLLDSKSRLARWPAHLLPCSVSIASMFGILDFVLEPQTTHTHISPVTALVLFLLASGVLFARRDWSMGALVAGAGNGGMLVRRLLPTAILTPLIIGWLRWKGQSAGLYSDWTGVALMTVTSIVLLAGLTVWTGFSVDSSERGRRRSQETVDRLASIVECSNDGIIGKTTEGIVTSWNPGAEAIYGYSAQEIVGRPISIVMPQDRQGEFDDMLEKVRRGKGISHYETKRLRKDGQTVFVSLAVSPLRDKTGRLIGVSTIARDVTERKCAEEKLHQASLYARSLIEASLDPLVTISKDGKIMDVNRATELVTGFERDKLIGSDFCNYFTQPAKARQGYEQVFAEETVQDYPLAIRHVSGRVMDVLYNASVFRNVAGEVEGVFAAARDVTKRKQAEDKIRNLNQELEERVHQRTAELHESERRVRRKLESILSPEGDLEHLELADLLDIPAVQRLAEEFYQLAHIPMFILDLKGNPVVAAGWQEVCTKFHRVHPDACKNCRESDQELSTGVVPGQFKLYQCKNHLWDAVTPLMLGEQQVGNLFSGQFFFTDERVDREMFRAQAHKYGFDEQEYLATLDRVPRLSRADVETGMTFYTRLAQLLSQLSYSGIKLARSASKIGRVNSELAASLKELEAFTYSVSHDLRAPLRHISGFSKILAEEYGSTLPLEAQHHVQRIQEGTHRMGVLVDDLLNLARVGRRDLSLQVAGLKSVVEGVLADLAPECEGRQIEWKIGDLPFVDCDPGLMKQVFQNLLSNAVKFTRPRSPAVIEVGQKDQDGTSVIFVRDNGVGFNMKYADKLFGVFQRLHRAEDFEGTGVGLATVQRIIQKHGGRIWVEAELDKGATFYFNLGVSEKTETKMQAIMAGGQA
jgi:PAS domain S-box-containing protein